MIFDGNIGSHIEFYVYITVLSTIGLHGGQHIAMVVNIPQNRIILSLFLTCFIGVKTEIPELPGASGKAKETCRKL